MKALLSWLLALAVPAFGADHLAAMNSRGGLYLRIPLLEYSIGDTSTRTIHLVHRLARDRRGVYSAFVASFPALIPKRAAGQIRIAPCEGGEWSIKPENVYGVFRYYGPIDASIRQDPAHRIIVRHPDGDYLFGSDVLALMDSTGAVHELDIGPDVVRLGDGSPVPALEIRYGPHGELLRVESKAGTAICKYDGAERLQRVRVTESRRDRTIEFRYAGDLLCEVLIDGAMVNRFTWRDVDPDLPAYAAARREPALLQQDLNSTYTFYIGRGGNRLAREGPSGHEEAFVPKDRF